MQDSTEDTAWQKKPVLLILHWLVLAEWYRKACKSSSLSYMGCFSFVCAIAWMYQACNIHWDSTGKARMVSFTAMPWKALRNNTSPNVEKAKRIIAHFINEDVSRVLILTDSVERNRFVCSIGKREPFFIEKVPAECRSNVATFSVNHCTNGTFMCNSPIHQEIIWHPLPPTVVERKLVGFRDKMKNLVIKLQNKNFSRA